MFSIFQSDQAKTRRHAGNMLRLAERVYHYRKDLLTENELRELLAATGQLHDAFKGKAEISKLRLATGRLEEILRKYGGPECHRSGWRENVEVFLVASILAIGIRTFFIQPFKIPTNSMWPSYYGMTHQVFHEPEEAPGPVARGFRKVFWGATRHMAVATAGGEVRIPVQYLETREGGQYRLVPPRPVQVRRWLILSGQAQQFTLLVGNEPVHLRVPLEFQFEHVLRETLFPDAPSFNAGLAERFRQQDVQPAPGNLFSVGTGRVVQAGEPVIHFDLLTGDQLFVDRFSYHFVRPKIGDAFVFRTGNIEGMSDQEDKYYIKRLVGGPGDTLEIVSPVLLRNGEPINGRKVFQKMNNQVEPFTGFVHEGRMGPGRQITLPEGAYFALGDNSPNSLDSRAWGFVPEREIVGRAWFIYYPFTRRWGPAK